MLPTPEVGVFEFCTAIARNQRRLSALENQFLQDNAFTIKAVLRRLSTVDGRYLATLRVPADGSMASAQLNRTLESLTRVRGLLKLAHH